MARDFDGISDFIDTSNILDPNSTPFTAVIWAKADAFPSVSNSHIAVQQLDGTGNGATWFYVSRIGTNDVRLQSWIGNTQLRGSTNISGDVGKYLHFALTTSSGGSGTSRLYLNGVQDVSATRNPLASDGGITLGKFKTTFQGLEHWDGSLAEFAVWDVELSSTEIAALAQGITPDEVRPGNLKAYLPLFGKTSPEPDMTGNDHDGTLTGTTSAEHVVLSQTSPSEFEDRLFRISDDADDSKVLEFSLGGATADKTATVVSSHTDNRTITLPDADATLVGTDTNQNLSNKTINATDNSITDIATQAGDLLKSDGTKFAKLSKGSTNQVLTSTATDIQWSDPASGSGTYDLLGERLVLGDSDNYIEQVSSTAPDHDWFRWIVNSSPVLEVRNNGADDDGVKVYERLLPNTDDVELGRRTKRWNAWINGWIDFDDKNIPPTPQAGEGRLFWDNDEFKQIDSNGTTKSLVGSGGANTALSNLSGVSINASLVPDTDDTKDLGSSSKQWKDIHVKGVAHLDTARIKTLEGPTATDKVILNDDLDILAGKHIDYHDTDTSASGTNVILPTSGGDTSAEGYIKIKVKGVEKKIAYWS